MPSSLDNKTHFRDIYIFEIMSGKSDQFHNSLLEKFEANFLVTIALKFLKHIETK